ncbi:struthiocalcin-2-like isoform X2 [Mixophyes fleayi]|uniref:struthiocalcin-2-like isoform X2 n=1 Tax=Mixophyes fleayi TaxID=3061075 RepID=UPI003F4DA24B
MQNKTSRYKMYTLQYLSLTLILLCLPGSLGLIFGKHDDSRSSEIHLPFLHFGGSSHENKNKPSVSDDLNPEYFCQGPCKDGWISHLGYCHKYVSRELSWKDAETHCQSLFTRSHLTSVLSEKHNQFLMALARSQGYLGDKLWTGGSKEKGPNSWADGSPLNFLKLPKVNLFGIFGGNLCISLNLGGGSFWDELTCAKKIHFICIYKPSEP